MITFPIKGVKWFREIINDQQRQFGVEAHNVFPEKKLPVLPYGKGTSIIRLPEQQRLVEDMEYHFGGLPATRIFPETYAATIQNGTIVGHSGMIITPDGYLIAETASMTGFRDGRSFMIEDLRNPSFKPPYRGHLNSWILSAANPNGGYAHHMRESFFPLLWFDNHDIDLIHVSEGTNAERMYEFTEHLGVPKEMFLVGKRTETISADRVSFFAPCAVPLYRPETEDMVRKLLLEPFRREDIKPTKKVFLKSGTKTAGAHARKVTGIDQLEQFLEEKGFEVIDPAVFSLPEKIDFLQEVETALMTYGSAGANVELSLNYKMKTISIPKPISIIQGNIMGHNGQLPTYSCPVIFPVYPEYCKYNGYLMTQEMASIYYSSRRPTGQFFPRHSPDFTSNFGLSIDMDIFKRFYNFYVENIELQVQ